MLPTDSNDNDLRQLFAATDQEAVAPDAARLAELRVLSTAEFVSAGQDGSPILQAVSKRTRSVSEGDSKRDLSTPSLTLFEVAQFGHRD